MSNDYIDFTKTYIMDEDVAPFEYVDGHPINVFSLLAEKKKKLFNIDKPIKDIDENDILDTLIMAIDSITIDDYRAFMQEVKPYKTSLEYTNDIIGLTNYLYTFAEQAGYYDLACILDEKRHPEKNKIRKMNYASMFAITMFSLCQKAAEKIYQAKREALPLPKLPKRPERYIAPNNTLINAMSTKALINAGAVDLTVSQEKEITTYAMILDTENEQTAPYKLPKFERIVSSAIGSIYIQAKKDGYDRVIVTPASIYKAMPGGGDRVTPKAAEQIDKAVEKMRGRKVVIDATSELAAYKKIGSDEKFLLDDFMIHARRGVYICRNRKETVGWEIFTKPALFEYAEKSGELVNVPAKVMQIPTMQGVKSISLNETRRELWDYLVRRVVVIKRAYEKAKKESDYKRNEGKTIEQIMALHGKSPVILYQTAFNAVDITTTNRAVLKENRDFCKWLMTYWKKLEFICDYQEVKQGNTRKGIKILFD